MRFKVDENLPIEAAEILRSAGHDASTIIEQNLGGEADSDIILVCQQEQRTLVTLDLDFADIRAYPPERFAGLVVLRLKQQDKLRVLATLRRLLLLLASEPVEQHLWIVDEKRVRIRGK